MNCTIVLGASGEASFDISLNDNPFVHKWIEEFRWCLVNCEFNQYEAFAGMLSLNEAADKLQQSCDIINTYLKKFIEIRTPIVDQPQDYFNYLHLKFEQLSGNFGTPSRLFSIANQELKDAIRDLNFYLHRVETKQDRLPNFYISFNKDQYRRQPLSQQDYKYFEFFVPAGTLYVSYVELGKEFADLYKDNLPIDYINGRNLHYYSGEAMLRLSDFDCFKDPGYVNWLKSNNVDPYDKTLGHGKIPLGSVNNPEDVYAKLLKHKHIKEIIIKD